MKSSKCDVCLCFTDVIIKKTFLIIMNSCVGLYLLEKGFEMICLNLFLQVSGFAKIFLNLIFNN